MAYLPQFTENDTAAESALIGAGFDKKSAHRYAHTDGRGVEWDEVIAKWVLTEDTRIGQRGIPLNRYFAMAVDSLLK